MTDQEILQLYFDRNEKAISVTSDTYGGRLISMAQNMTARQDAEECVNDTYLVAWNKIPPTRPTHFLAWLLKVCRNIVCDRIDWNNAGKRSASICALTEEMSDILADSSTPYPGQGEELGRLMSDFLYGVSKQKRVIFLRRYWYGLSIKELAEEADMSESSVKTMLFRMRKDLKDYLLKEGVAL